MRISRDEMFIKIAHVVAERGTCPRAKVGAVLVNRHGKIRSIGYNGAPTGEPHCEEVGCKMEGGHCKRSVHAEINAIKLWQPMDSEYTLYVTHKPCEHCEKAILECKQIKRVVFDVPYRYYGPSWWELDGVTFVQHSVHQ